MAASANNLGDYYKKWEKFARDLDEESRDMRPPGSLGSQKHDSATLQAAARAQAQAEAEGPLDPSKISYSFGKPMSEAEFLAYRKTRAGANSRIVGTSSATV